MRSSHLAALATLWSALALWGVAVAFGRLGAVESRTERLERSYDVGFRVGKQWAQTEVMLARLRAAQESVLVYPSAVLQDMPFWSCCSVDTTIVSIPEDLAKP